MPSSYGSSPMDTAQWPKCPACGLPNIPERTLCKRCRTMLTGTPTQPAAATESTGTLYTSADAHHRLFVSLPALEYVGPGITLRSAWANIDSLRGDGVEEYLWLRTSATITLVRSRDPTLDTWREHTVPLRCFGYPTNVDLLTDLQRFASHIWAAHRSQQRR
jgi:hypothetical protein